MPGEGFTHTITIRPTPEELLGDHEKSDNQLTIGLAPFTHVDTEELLHFMVFDRLMHIRGDKRSSEITGAQYLGVHDDTMVFSATYPNKHEIKKSAQAAGSRVSKYLGRFGLETEVRLLLEERTSDAP